MEHQHCLCGLYVHMNMQIVYTCIPMYMIHLDTGHLNTKRCEQDYMAGFDLTSGPTVSVHVYYACMLVNTSIALASGASNLNCMLWNMAAKGNMV